MQKYQTGQHVLCKGRKATIWDYSIRYNDYIVEYTEDGYRERIEDESLIEPDGKEKGLRFIIELEVLAQNEDEALDIVYDILEKDQRVINCHIREGINEDTINDIAAEITRKTTMHRIK